MQKLLRHVWTNPESFRPRKTSRDIASIAARSLATLTTSGSEEQLLLITSRLQLAKTDLLAPADRTLGDQCWIGITKSRLIHCLSWFMYIRDRAEYRKAA
jgi:hypothetical protein